MSITKLIDLFNCRFAASRRRPIIFTLNTLEYHILIQSKEPAEDPIDCKSWHWEVTFDKGRPTPKEWGTGPTLNKACEIAIRTAMGAYGIPSYELYKRVKAAKEDAAVMKALATQGR